jgi:hypothetical protein
LLASGYLEQGLQGSSRRIASSEIQFGESQITSLGRSRVQLAKP